MWCTACCPLQRFFFSCNTVNFSREAEHDVTGSHRTRGERQSHGIIPRARAWFSVLLKNRMFLSSQEHCVLCRGASFGEERRWCVASIHTMTPVASCSEERRDLFGDVRCSAWDSIFRHLEKVGYWTEILGFLGRRNISWEAVLLWPLCVFHAEILQISSWFPACPTFFKELMGRPILTWLEQAGWHASVGSSASYGHPVVCQEARGNSLTLIPGTATAVPIGLLQSAAQICQDCPTLSRNRTRIWQKCQILDPNPTLCPSSHLT